ncbi:phosphoribosyltransferase [Oxalobacteraceae bacterium R-40]|uniref:Phosphoribosyltransferase n=1 Tax=Keguizhuia sedimenti TaxID=3064264 RepID=A0ABU1BQ46_9BURK|nr:phosphoribosyltransferase [Oxalobacteraceae bacterium R-40]
MQASTDKDLWVSWQEYERAIEALALKIHQSGWHFDLILCLARGGLRPGDILSRIFNLPLAILSTSSYREEAGRKQGELDIARHISISKGKIAGNVLLIDDLVDSGVTLQQVHRRLNEQFPDVNDIKTAVIWYKACSIFVPDFYLSYLQSNPWIHQPFEVYDSIDPDQLEDRLNQS